MLFVCARIVHQRDKVFAVKQEREREKKYEKKHWRALSIIN